MRGNLLHISEKGYGLLFYKNAFCYVNLRTGKREAIIHAQTNIWKRVCGCSRICSRFFRLEPRCAEILDNNRYIVCYHHKVWLLDITKNEFTSLQESRTGFSDPLNLGSDGTCVYWGDYGNNANQESVNVYRLSKNLNIDTVFSFPKGKIRHIHNIVWDPTIRHFYILTGDQEKTSGIYIADKDWKCIKPVLTGSQQYRSVVAFPNGGGLIYATDSVEEKNNIYILSDGITHPIANLPGSCIYGTELKDYYIFSTTVEPHEGRGLLSLFTYKLGAGIKDRYSHVFAVKKNNYEVREIFKAKKDMWPMKLFQYGAIMFPNGKTKDNTINYYVMACKGDGRTYKINIQY